MEGKGFGLGNSVGKELNISKRRVNHVKIAIADCIMSFIVVYMGYYLKLEIGAEKLFLLSFVFNLIIIFTLRYIVTRYYSVAKIVIAENGEVQLLGHKSERKFVFDTVYVKNFTEEVEKKKIINTFVVDNPVELTFTSTKDSEVLDMISCIVEEDEAKKLNLK